MYFCLACEIDASLQSQTAFGHDLFLIALSAIHAAPFEWVMAWKDMIGPHHYANMLEKNFFPKWLQVLSSWLANNPNYDEVTEW